jgi:16S rRNA (guanine527-N7)-methyltransferase
MILDKEAFIKECSSKLGIILDDSQINKLIKYYGFLIAWNEKINLTAITEFEEVCIKHFMDSFSIVKLFSSYKEANDFFTGKSLIDVGTGAGFPGVCLKILFPGLSVTLMDSLDKRVKFLNEVINLLELDGISAVHERAEKGAHSENYREVFDFSVARAVAALPVLCEYCIPFVKAGGYFIAYKSEKADEEINVSKNALDKLGGKISKKVSFYLPDGDLQRTLIVIKKEKETPVVYPRREGTPSKKPL